MHSKGFTLAEVLITLAIIGVVAAITIPSIIINYQNLQLKTQFKKAYSTMSQVYQKTLLTDFGGDVKCYYDKTGNYFAKDCAIFYDTLAKNLKVLKKCEGNAFEKGCVPNYEIEVDASGCGGFTVGAITTRGTAYLLQDGMILFPFFENSTSFYPQFLIDVNGHQKPNKGGYDIFSLSIKKDKFNKPYFENGCSIQVSGGKTLKSMLKWVYK